MTVAARALRSDAPTALVVQLPPLVHLTGLVRSRAAGTPVSGAQVHVARPGVSVDAGTTDAAGRFGPISAGGRGERQFVAVRAEGFADALVPVVLRATAGDTQEIEVLLGNAAPWRGRVVDDNGEPVEGAEVSTTSDGVAGAHPPERKHGCGRLVHPPCAASSGPVSQDRAVLPRRAVTAARSRCVPAPHPPPRSRSS